MSNANLEGRELVLRGDSLEMTPIKDHKGKTEYYLETIRISDTAVLNFLCSSFGLSAEELKKRILTKKLFDATEDKKDRTVLEHGVKWRIMRGRITACLPSRKKPKQKRKAA